MDLPQPHAVSKSSGFDERVLRFRNACKRSPSTSSRKHSEDGKKHLFSYGEVMTLAKDPACEVTARPKAHYTAEL